jgi:signal transduction histidine kinase
MDKKTTVAKSETHEPGPDFESVLAAWHDTTLQLEQSHEALHDQVCRLTRELENARRQLDLQNRLAMVGQMTARIADDLRNHLMPVVLNLSLVKRRVGDDPLGLNLVGKIESGFTTVEATINDVVRFASDRTPRWGTFSLRKLVDEVRESLSVQLEARAIETVIDVPDGESIQADRDMLRQSILNLMLNAVEAMPEGGTLTVTSASTERGLELEVADTGRGLPEDATHQVFEPFFSTKLGGTGLGLAIVHHMIESHGGCVTAMNCPEGGAAFTLCVPQRRLKVAA